MNSERTNWSLVVLLCATTTAGYMCRVNVSTAGVLIMEDFRLTQVEMGRIFGAFLLGYAIFQYPAGWLADRLGARKVLMGGAMLCFLFTVLPIFISLSSTTLLGFSFSIFVIFRVLMGIAASPAYPASAKGVSMWIPVSAQGRANGIILMSIGLGSALTPPLVSHAMVEWGWRTAMIISAMPALMIALIWRRFPDPPVVARPESIQSNPVRVPGPSERRKGFYLLTLSYTLQGYVGYIFVSWFYLYLVQERKFDVLTGAWASSLPWALSVAAIPLGGVVVDQLRRRGRGFSLFPLVAMSLSGVFIAMGAHTESAWVAAGALAVATALILCVEGPFWTAAIQLAPEDAGKAGGIMNTGSNLGGMISPVITPMLAEAIGWENALHLSAGIAVIAGLLWLGIREESTGDAGPGNHLPATT